MLKNEKSIQAYTSNRKFAERENSLLLAKIPKDKQKKWQCAFDLLELAASSKTLTLTNKKF